MFKRAPNKTKTKIESMSAAARKRANNGRFWCVSAMALLPLAGLAQDVKPLLPLPPPVVSTVPNNGDVNPYGVVFVPRSFGAKGLLHPGDILVSNFNNNANLQGTGTTIIRVGADGQASLFFQGQPSLGLTAALGVVRYGFVFVGNLPTRDGTSGTAQPGSLLILDSNGTQVGQLVNPDLVNGPWGMAIHDAGDTAQVFISNVLTGSIVRLDLIISADADAVVLKQAVLLGSGFNHRPDPAALLLGPSGLCYDSKNDLLYVASSADNAIYAIADAGATLGGGGTGALVYQDNLHLHGPLDLVMAPNGDLIVANSDGSNVDPNQPSEIVEFTPGGKFVAQYSIDKANGGAFGLNLINAGAGNVKFAAVNDNQNTLSTWTFAIK
jgi:hypothetical protein